MPSPQRERVAVKVVSTATRGALIDPVRTSQAGAGNAPFSFTRP